MSNIFHLKAQEHRAQQQLANAERDSRVNSLASDDQAEHARKTFAVYTTADAITRAAMRGRDDTGVIELGRRLQAELDAKPKPEPPAPEPPKAA